ncbi:hypothetical protein BDP27DRAFT_1319484, partial [Rhodocollybia butyracea]
MLLYFLLFVLLGLNLHEEDSVTGLLAAPVCFYSDTDMVFFYEGKIYVPVNDSIFTIKSLPEPKKEYKNEKFTAKPPVWVLVDWEGDKNVSSELIKGSGDIFIVQPTLPNFPARCQTWVRSRDAIEIGLPLWNRELLHQGWKSQKEQHDFEERIIY